MPGSDFIQISLSDELNWKLLGKLQANGLNRSTIVGGPNS
jgi:hypothetical protein